MRLTLVLLLLLQQQPAPIVIREHVSPDQWICAEYSVGLTRKPNRSCVPAATVRQWILQNARPDQ